ncbi:DUF2336 domain-containing protein [Methylobacterium sp. Leaf466]|uniref:DUF2336 domain-containing protein n=1 Tax=Methylobacterium sp. Leaf466 TaxID=1736386 RepID=UPI0006F92F89|nr:DUF2336 domain-containing protein [Methylobacterium sp. Leaf466]KQT78676.1 hypothetical protein ASG59_05640 [Methylobacterium sp. Leaf466]
MVAALASLLTDIEDSVARGGLGRRDGLLRGLTTLFTDEAPRLGEDQVAAFDAVILHLAREMEDAARAELSERLADIPNAPRGVVRDLAFDAVLAVARPVLARSRRLVDADLAALASRRGQGHLLAMARRLVLKPAVADILVARGEPEVVRLVAGNPGARFTPQGFMALGDRAFADADLGQMLARRGDLPADLRLRLANFARVRAAEPTPTPLPPVRSNALLAAEVFVSTQARRVDIDEGVLIAWIRAGKVMEALVGLARLAGVPSQMAVDAYESGSYEPLLPIVRSIRFGWRILSSLTTARTADEPPPEMMHDVMQAFQGLSVVAAQAQVRAAAARYRRP